jgi:hypothetical protein
LQSGKYSKVLSAELKKNTLPKRPRTERSTATDLPSIKGVDMNNYSLFLKGLLHVRCHLNYK